MGTMHAEGVTLIDLLVTVAVVAMVFAIGVPAFSDFAANSRMSSSTNDIVTSLQLARAEAIRRDGRVRVCPADDWQLAAPSCNDGGELRNGWLVVHEPADGGAPTVLSIREPLPDSITYTGPNDLRYAGNQPPTDAGGNSIDFVIDLCDERGDENIGGGRSAGRRLLLRRPSGRPRLFDQVGEVDCGG